MNTKKQILSLILTAAVGLSIVCVNPPAENKNQTSEILALGAVAYAMTSLKTVQGSCSAQAVGECIDYISGWTTSQMQTDCAGNTFTSNVACPSTNRVGSCAITGKGGTISVAGTTSVYRYYSSNFSTGTAQTNCTTVNSGVFTAN